MDIGLNINLLQWNIQGFINHKYELELLVASHKPNIIALQETHIIDKNKHLLHLPGYKVYHQNKDYVYAKSGIALLVKNNINVTQHITSTGDLLFQKIIIKCNTEIHIAGRQGWQQVRTLVKFTIDGKDIKDLEVIELS